METRRVFAKDHSDDHLHAAWVKKKTGEDGKPIWETSYLNGPMRDVAYFDTQKEAHDHVNALIPDRKRPPRVVVNAHVPAAQKVRTPPIRRGWRANRDGSYTRVNGDVVGTIRPLRGMWVATFTDGRIFKDREFTETTFVQTHEYEGQIGVHTSLWTDEDRRRVALDWVDAQFDAPSTRRALAAPLTARQKQLRAKRVQRAIEAGTVTNEMDRAQRQEAEANAIRLQERTRTPDPAVRAVRRVRATLPDIPDTRTDLRQSSNEHRPVPLLPPDGKAGRGRRDESPVDHGLTWTGVRAERRSVSRDGKHIGIVQRTKRSTKDSPGEIWIALPVIGDPSGSEFPNEWQAAQELRRFDDADRAGEVPAPVVPRATRPEGYESITGFDEMYSWRKNNMTKDRAWNIAVYTERIGSIRQVNGRWAVYPIDEPAKALTHRSRPDAIRALIAHHDRKRAKAGVPVTVVPATPVDVTPVAPVVPDPPATMPKPPKKRRVRLRQGGGLPTSNTIIGRPEPEDHIRSLTESSSLSHPIRTTKLRSSGIIPFGEGLAAPSVDISRWPLVRTMRRTYDEDTLNAVNKFETAYQVDPDVREQLRQLEATGQYRWMYTGGVASTNYDEAWIFAPSSDGLTPDGPVLALSQPAYGNYAYVPPAIAEAIEMAYEQWGDEMPEPFRPDAEGPAVPATIKNPKGDLVPPKDKKVPPKKGKSADDGMESKEDFAATKTLGMVAAYPDAATRDRVRKIVGDTPGAHDPAGYHMTLVFLGEIADLPEGHVEIMRDAISGIELPGMPIHAVVGGQVTFDGGTTVFLVDGKGVAELHTDINRALEAAGIENASEHGFTAHMSVVSGDDTPDFDAVGTPLVFDRITLALGEDRHDVVGGVEKKAERRVRDAAFWGMPVGTLIEPGMKPQGSKPKPSTSPSGHDAPSRRVRVIRNVTTKPVGKTPSGHDKPERGVDIGAVKDKPTDVPGTQEDAVDNTPLDTSPRMATDFSVEAAAKELKKIKVDGRAAGAGTLDDPVDVGDDLELAHRLLSEGKHIRMDTPMGVSSLINKIREMGEDAKAKGADAPEYDLCKVSVPKTNLFCMESKGIPRVKMPQFKGDATDGTFAATRRNAKGEGDVEPEWSQLLESMGIATTPKIVKASHLKASQDNLDGVKVAGMAKAMADGKIPDAPIFVTRDGYILDGHHRWAAKVVTSLEGDDVDMPVVMIDCEIGYAIDLANGFTEMAGIKRKGMGAAADAVKRMPLDDDGPCTTCGDAL